MNEKMLFFIELNQYLIASKSKTYKTIMLIGIFIK
jgi:hypothetical protein